MKPIAYTGQFICCPSVGLEKPSFVGSGWLLVQTVCTSTGTLYHNENRVSRQEATIFCSSTNFSNLIAHRIIKKVALKCIYIGMVVWSLASIEFVH